MIDQEALTVARQDDFDLAELLAVELPQTWKLATKRLMREGLSPREIMDVVTANDDLLTLGVACACYAAMLIRASLLKGGEN